MKRIILFPFILGGITLGLLNCTNSNPKSAYGNLGTTRAGVIIPVDFPQNLGIEGFTFPRDSNTLNGWIRKNDEESLRKQYTHAWGIWTGLNQLTSQKGSFDDSLRVFETWRSPKEIIHIMNEKKGQLLANDPGIRSNRANLEIPNQFLHGSNAINLTNDNRRVASAYSPAAEAYALKNKIFSGIQLYNYVLQGKNAIDPFPNDAINIKPVYFVLNLKDGKTSFSLPVWPPNKSTGYPDAMEGYEMEDWANSVQIDINKKESDPANKIFALSDFIHYKMNDEDANAMGHNAEAGDIAVLVAMHVTTKEIENWTWETFWWTPDADNPAFPSSKAIVDARPAQLKGAARHYAMCLTNYMVNPNEPYATSDKVIGNPNYGFNPYLEADFDQDVFDAEIPSEVNTKKGAITTNIGIKTNCMSCHRLAAINLEDLANKRPAGAGYVGNAYVNQRDAAFKNMLLVDFAFSIGGRNIDTVGLREYIMQHPKNKK